jgi:hypothetical protein
LVGDPRRDAGSALVEQLSEMIIERARQLDGAGGEAEPDRVVGEEESATRSWVMRTRGCANSTTSAPATRSDTARSGAWRIRWARALSVAIDRGTEEG